MNQEANFIRVKLGDIRPDRFRNLERWPVERSVVEGLKQSINKSGFLERILIINPAGTPNHIHPELYRDQKYLIPAGDEVIGLASAIQRRVAMLSGSFGELVRSGSLTLKPAWYGRQATSAEYFTGRSRALWRIHRAFACQSVLGDPRLHAGVAGSGGTS